MADEAAAVSAEPSPAIDATVLKAFGLEVDDSSAPVPEVAADAVASEAGAEEPVKEEPAAADAPRWTLDAIEDHEKWTDAEVKEAAAYMKEQTAKLQKHWGVSRKKREAVERDRNALEAEMKHVRTFAESVQANVRALYQGDAQARLNALSALTGKSPAEVLEELNFGIASNGQQKPGGTTELERQVKALEAKLEQRDAAQAAVAETERVRGIVGRAVVDANRWPVAAEVSKADPAGAARQVFAMLEANPGVTVAQAMDRIELELMRQKAKGPPSAPKPAPGKAPRSPAAKEKAKESNGETRLSERDRLQGIAAVVDRFLPV